MAILTAFSFLSSSGVGHSWETDAVDWIWTPENNTHEDSVPAGEYDAQHQFYNYNANVQQMVLTPLTEGAATYQDPDEIDDDPLILVFHTECVLYLYWGTGSPSPPEDLESMWVKGSLTLYREVPANTNQWVQKCHDEQYYEISEEGSKTEQLWLHVTEDRNYQPGDVYKLVIHISGGYRAGGEDEPLDSDMATSYYEIVQ